MKQLEKKMTIYEAGVWCAVGAWVFPMIDLVLSMDDPSVVKITSFFDDLFSYRVVGQCRAVAWLYLYKRGKLWLTLGKEKRNQ